MSEQAGSIRIPDDEIREKYKAAAAIIDSAEGASLTAGPSEPAAFRPTFMSPNIPGSTSVGKREKSDLASALRAPDGDPLLSPTRQAVLFHLRRAVAVGMVASEYAAEPLGFAELARRAQANALTSQEDKDRFSRLLKVKAAIAMFAAAAHLARALGERPTGEPGNLGEISCDKTVGALGWLVHRLAVGVRGVAEDRDVHPAVARVCYDVMDRAESEARRLAGVQLADFEATNYAVDEDKFRLSGFQRPSTAPRKRVEVAPKHPEDVVGNHVAKAQSLRLARMLCCYDFQVGKNPFVEIGGFIFTSIGDGQPGTGKTTLIQMTVTLIKGICDRFKYEFNYENFGVDQISEFQGKSGQNCRAFIERTLNPRAIGFGTIDDIDQVAGRRDDKRSSGGQQEVTAVLMDAFAGAGTVVRGNATFFMASNYPEQVDDALRQRAAMRWLIDGPQSRDDYVDILALLVGKTDVPLGAHDLFAAQSIRKMVDQTYESFNRPHEDRLVEVWDDYIRTNGQPKTISDFGGYLYRIKEADPRFTGRAVKNITDAVKTRSMDVDLPDEWFETPEAFVAKPYEEKVAMLARLRKPVTIEMLLQEINRYADSEFRYSGKSDDAEIARIVREQGLFQKAQKLLAAAATEGR